MPQTRIFKPANRLAKVLDSRDAPTTTELVEAAEARVRGMVHGLTAYVDEQCGRIAEVFGAGEGLALLDYRAIGTAALNVAEVAGACGAVAVGDVTRGIHAMVESLVEGGAWDSGAFRLHVETLVLVRQRSGPPTAEDIRLLQGLRAIRRKVGIDE